ncbi:MAG: GTP-binding protein [Anaerolineae bacterium]|nr:GTP-binding protein [Anaerolineae bacterium]NIN97115.1 GTP-binding protein [Anaerolineae bacterium]NIQ80088.1 GTP-binding protein [Anaerolineae bacterium]
MEQIKVVVTGPFGAGKTQFINTISEIDVVTTERRISVPEQRKIKEETTVAMDYGYITIKKDVVLELFGTPGQRRFDFMFDILSRGMWGFVVLVDSTDPSSFHEARDIVKVFDNFARVPRVIAANKQDQRGAVSPDELRKALKLEPSVKILPCKATHRASVRKVLLGLLSSMLAQVNAS